jgi:hypothetical protein
MPNPSLVRVDVEHPTGSNDTLGPQSDQWAKGWRVWRIKKTYDKLGKRGQD